MEAVASLRERLSARQVYGIIDRDFEELPVHLLVPPNGIMRTFKCTLENYLLDPYCWASVFAFIFWRHTDSSLQWQNPVQVQSYIEQCYRDCLPLAAHNYVIKHGCDQYPQQAAATHENERTYRDHPEALAGLNPAAKLRAWGQQMNATEDLGDLFAAKLAHLEHSSVRDWEQYVSGKIVLAELHRRFPRLPRGGRFPLDHYVDLYLRECPDPPPELVNLVDLILQDAHA